MKGIRLREAIEDAGFLVFNDGPRPNAPKGFVVRKTSLEDVAWFEVFEDSAFRLGWVMVAGKQVDQLSWPEFFTALDGVKR